VRDVVSGVKVIFRVITLLEPPKATLLPYLVAEKSGKPIPCPERIALVHYYEAVPSKFYEAKVNLTEKKLYGSTLLEGRVSYQDGVDMKAVEEACLANPAVKKAIEALQLPTDATVLVEPWTYGTDGLNDMRDRITMVRTRFQRCKLIHSVIFTCGCHHTLTQTSMLIR
jgi:primary-amine oxidase